MARQKRTVRTWGYRDGTLLGEGFVQKIEPVGLTVLKSEDDVRRRLWEAEAELAAVIRLAESCGIEVCMAYDGDPAPGPDDEEPGEFEWIAEDGQPCDPHTGGTAQRIYHMGEATRA